MQKIILFVLGLGAMPLLCGADGLLPIVVKLERSTILLVEVNDVSGCPAPGLGCTAHITGRVVRVLNDATQKGGLLTGFEADVRQDRFRDLGTPAWTGISIEKGGMYVVQSVRGTLTEMIQHPSPVVPVSALGDYLGDVDLILASGRLSLPDQCSAVSKAITTSPLPRSPEMVDYMIQLLEAGSSDDRAGLAQAIEISSSAAFSEWAKNSLLVGLQDLLRDSKDPEGPLVHLLVMLTARYLADAPEKPALDVPDLLGPISRYDIPWILGSERARSILQGGLPLTLAGRVRQRALQFSGNGRFTAAERDGLRRFADLAAPPVQVR